MTRSFFAFVLFSSVFGCNSPVPPPNSFTNVYQTVIEPKCVNAYCHYAGISLSRSGLDMSAIAAAYWGLVDQPCQSISCTLQGTRVVPGRPDGSMLYLKIAKSPPPCGVQMPASVTAANTPPFTPEFSGTQLPSNELDLIRAWISEGALNN